MYKDVPKELNSKVSKDTIAESGWVLTFDPTGQN